MNPSSARQITVRGGVPPYRFEVVQTDDSSGQATVDAHGMFRSGPRPSTSVVRVEDATGATANVTLSVRPSTLFVLGGLDVQLWLTYDSVFRSTEGTLWQRAGSLPAIREDGAATVFNDAIWYAGGFDGDAERDEVYRSNDGRAWELAGRLPEARVSGSMVVFDGELVFIGGTTVDGDADSTRDELFASADGQVWRLYGRLRAPTQTMAAMVYRGRIWVLGGLGLGGVAFAEIASSADGLNWRVEGDLPESRFGFGLAELRGEFWIFGGRNSDHLFDVLVSSDGSTWTWAGFGPSGLYAGAHAAFADRLWWIGGSSAPGGLATTDEVASSTDGISWIVSPGGYPLAVAWVTAVTFSSGE